MTPRADISGPWEVRDDAEALWFVAGHLSGDAYIADRRARAADILDALAPGPSAAGLEIGSGEGVVAELLAAHCGRLTYADISSSLLMRSRKRCAHRSNVDLLPIRDDYLDGIPADSVDFAYALNVSIHLNHHELFHYLLDLRRVLRSNGRAWFNVASLAPGTPSTFSSSRARTTRTLGTPPRATMYFHSPDDVRYLAELAELPSWSAVEMGGMISCLVAAEKE